MYTRAECISIVVQFSVTVWKAATDDCELGLRRHILVASVLNLLAIRAYYLRDLPSWNKNLFAWNSMTLRSVFSSGFCRLRLRAILYMLKPKRRKAPERQPLGRVRDRRLRLWDLPFGGVAQLGEHLLCKQGVRGSIPLISTSRKFRRPKLGGESSDWKQVDSDERSKTASELPNKVRLWGRIRTLTERSIKTACSSGG